MSEMSQYDYLERLTALERQLQDAHITIEQYAALMLKFGVHAGRGYVTNRKANDGDVVLSSSRARSA